MTKDIVNHKDGDPQNNAPSNLEVLRVPVRWMKFNINDHFRVKLTERGRGIFRGDGGTVPDNGVVVMQAWRLMQLFGPHMRFDYNGSPFDNWIEIEED
jgi:HNH endonuclease